MIEDKRLEKRLKNFKKTENTSDCLIKRCQEKSLQLRKDKLSEKIMNKRLGEINKNINKFEVNTTNLKLDSSFLSTYDNQVKKVKFLSFLLENENIDINYIKFALMQIRCIICQLTSKKELQINDFDEDLISNILNFLINYDDNEIKFESSWILINATFLSNEVVELIGQKTNIKDLFKLLENSQEEILVNIIWIFSNLFAQDEETRYSITNQIPFHSRFLKILSQNSLNKDLRSILLFCFKNLTKNLNYKETYSIKLIDEMIIKIIENYINDKYAINDDILNQILEVFEEITAYGNEYMIHSMYRIHFFQKLIQIIDDFEKCETILVKRAISLIGNAFICENSEITTWIFGLGLCHCFDKLIINIKTSNQIQGNELLIKQICWSIANIMATSESINLQLLDSNVIKNIIEIAFDLNDVLINKEVCIGIYNFLDYAQNQSKLNLIILTRVNEYLCKVLFNSLDNDLLSICLQDIYILLQYGQYEMDSKIIKGDFEKLGVTDRLEKLTTHDNDDVRLRANSTLDEFWK